MAGSMPMRGAFTEDCDRLNITTSKRAGLLRDEPRKLEFGRNRMAIKSDKWIRRQATENKMIEPFSEKQVRDGVISYGLSSYGYDLRVSDEFKIFTNVNSAIIDPKDFDERSFVSVQAASIIVPPNSFALARSVEYFRIPRDVLTICVGKSTTPLPARIYANEGLCQILFFQGDEPCETSYADRKGKYQKQQGIVLPKL
jgi:dCTP deaminase